jgi:hypothetical protein
MPARYLIRILVGSITDKRSRSAALDRSAIDGFQQNRRRWFGADSAPVVKIPVEHSALVRLTAEPLCQSVCLRPPAPRSDASHASQATRRVVQEHHAVVDAGTYMASTRERSITACQHRKTRLIPFPTGKEIAPQAPIEECETPLSPVVGPDHKYVLPARRKGNT